MKKNVLTKLLLVLMLGVSLQLSAQNNKSVIILDQGTEPLGADFEALTQNLQTQDQVLMYFDQDTRTLQQWDGQKWLPVGVDIMDAQRFDDLTVKLQGLTAPEQALYQGMEIYDQDSRIMQQWDGTKWLPAQSTLVVNNLGEILAPVDDMIAYEQSTQTLSIYQGSQWQTISSATGLDNLGNHTLTQTLIASDKWISPFASGTAPAAISGMYVADQADKGFIGIGKGFDALAPQAALEIKITDEANQLQNESKAFILRDQTSGSSDIESFMVKLTPASIGTPSEPFNPVTLGTENGAFQFEVDGLGRLNVMREFETAIPSVRMGLGLGYLESTNMPEAVMHLRASEYQSQLAAGQVTVPLVQLEAQVANQTSLEKMRILQPTAAQDFFSFNRTLAATPTQLQKVYAFETQEGTTAPVKHLEIYTDAQWQSRIGIGLAENMSPEALMHVRTEPTTDVTTPLVQLQGAVQSEYMRILQPTIAKDFFSFNRTLAAAPTTSTDMQKVYAFETQVGATGAPLHHMEIYRDVNFRTRVGLGLLTNETPLAAMHVRLRDTGYDTPLLTLEGVDSDKTLKIQEVSADQFDITVPTQKLRMESSELFEIKIKEEAQPRMQVTKQPSLTAIPVSEDDVTIEGTPATTANAKVIKIQEGDIWLQDIGAGIIMKVPDESANAPQSGESLIRVTYKINAQGQIVHVFEIVE